jgi:two-component system CheB/CheR fusion protein
MTDAPDREPPAPSNPAESSEPTGDPGWPLLLRYLQLARGIDLHGYKPNTLARRIRKRMATIGVPTFAGYRDYLAGRQDEFGALFDTILINVTGFFRDPPAWEAVRTLALPEIVASRPAPDPIRVWSAGCASGEEAYTLAMLFAEQLGLERFRDQVTIYGTDVDEEALTTARRAVYSPGQVAGVPAELLERYFEPADGFYRFSPELRRQMIFGGHDLLGDAPISRVDLLACRNTLMYFNAETQARVLDRFHFALSEGGFLLLGRAESLMTQADAFTPVDPRHRLSRKAARGSRGRFGAAGSDPPPSGSRAGIVIVDRELVVLAWNREAGALWGVQAAEASGRHLLALHTGLPVEPLREALRDCVDGRSAGRQVPIDGVNRRGKTIKCTIGIRPLLGADDSIRGAILLMEEAERQA